MRKKEIVVSVGDSLSGLVDYAGGLSHTQPVQEPALPEVDLFGVIYSMYAARKRKGVTWTKERITLRVKDVLHEGNAGVGTDGQG